MARLVKRYNDGGGEILDTAAMAENLKNDSLFFKNGKYTNYGKKHLEALDQIEQNQSSGIRYKIDSDAGTFRTLNSEGSRIDEDIEGGGLKIGESGLFKRDQKLVSRVLSNAVYKEKPVSIPTVDSLPMKTVEELNTIPRELVGPINLEENKPVVENPAKTKLKVKPTTNTTNTATTTNTANTANTTPVATTATTTPVAKTNVNVVTKLFTYPGSDKTYAKEEDKWFVVNSDNSKVEIVEPNRVANLNKGAIDKNSVVTPKEDLSASINWDTDLDWIKNTLKGKENKIAALMGPKIFSIKDPELKNALKKYIKPGTYDNLNIKSKNDLVAVVDGITNFYSWKDKNLSTNKEAYKKYITKFAEKYNSKALTYKINKANSVEEIKKIIGTIYDKNQNGLIYAIPNPDNVKYDPKTNTLIVKDFGKETKIPLNSKGGRLIPKAKGGLSGLPELPTPKFKTTATFGGYNPYPWRSYPNRLDYMQNSLDLNSNPNTDITANTNTTSDYAPWNEEVYDFNDNNKLTVDSLPLKTIEELNPRNFTLNKAPIYSNLSTENNRKLLENGFSDRFRQAAQKIGNYDNNIGSFLGSNIGTGLNAALAYKAYKTPIGEYSHKPMLAERQAVPNVLAARKLNTNEQNRQASKIRTDFKTSNPELNGILNLGAASRTNQALANIASTENQFRLQEQERVVTGENARNLALTENNNLTTRTINANNQLETQTAMQKLQAEQARTNQFYQNLGTIGNELQGRVNTSNSLDKQYAMAAYAQDGQQKYASAKLNYDDALLKLKLADSRGDSPEEIKIYEQALENAKNNMPKQKTLQEIMDEMRSFKKGNFPWES